MQHLYNIFLFLDANLELESNKRLSILNSQTSVPSTPTPFLNQNVFNYPPLSDYSTPATTKFDFNQYQSSFQSTKNPIKNLTAHFMMNESSNNNEMLNNSIDQAGFRAVFLKKRISNKSAEKSHLRCKSLSDTNLYFDLDAKLQSKSNNLKVNNQKITFITPSIDSDSTTDSESYRNKLVKSEMRDSNIKDPSLMQNFSGLPFKLNQSEYKFNR